MFYPRFGALFLALVLVGCAGGRANQPLPKIDDSEIVGVLYGETYTYGRLKLSDADAKLFGTRSAKGLRAKAIGKLRIIALRETVRRRYPDCELNVTQNEIASFVDWWRAAALEIQDSIPVARVASGPDFSRIDEISMSNNFVVTHATDKLLVWKANKCLYEHHGGGRLHEASTSTSVEVIHNNTPVANYGKERGIVYPLHFGTGNPLNAYIKHYDLVLADGGLEFPDIQYEELFFNYYRNERLRYFATDQATKVINFRYWETPYSAEDAVLR